jgi:hypothetical protein
MTSAPQLFHVSLSSWTLSGLPPRFFESQRIILSGSMCFLMRPVMVGPKVRSWSEPIQMRNQSGLWMHVESAAPMPVPVQMRMPRLYIAEAWPTPAIQCQRFHSTLEREVRTELQLPSPYCLWRVCHEVPCKVTLHAADHVVVRSFPPLTDDAEGMILHHRSAANAA